MAHKITTVLALLMTIFVVGCAGKSAPIAFPTGQPSVATSEKSEKMTAEEEEIFIAVTLSDEEKAVRALAEEIRQRKALEEAKRAVVALDTPEMREARRQLQREADRERELRRELLQNRIQANVTGCMPGDIEMVQVASRAVGVSRLNPTVIVRVTNPYQFPIDIEDEMGIVLRHLCGGGSATITRSRNLWADGNYMTFHWTARGQFDDGSQGAQRSRSFQLSAYDQQSGRSRQNDSWVVRLQRVSQ